MTGGVVVARRPVPITRRRLRASTPAPLLAVLPVLLAMLLTASPVLAQTPSGGAGGDAATATTTSTPAPLVKDTTPLPDAVTGGDDAKDGVSGTSTTGAIAKLVVGLAVVLGVIYGVYWLLRSANRSKRKGGVGDGRMAVVGTTVLSPGRSLHLVRVGDDLVLVGSAEHAVTRVHAWTGEDARRLDGSLTQPIEGLADGGAGARLLDEIRRRTVRG